MCLPTDIWRLKPYTPVWQYAGNSRGGALWPSSDLAGLRRARASTSMRASTRGQIQMRNPARGSLTLVTVPICTILVLATGACQSTDLETVPSASDQISAVEQETLLAESLRGDRFEVRVTDDKSWQVRFGLPPAVRTFLPGECSGIDSGVAALSRLPALRAGPYNLLAPPDVQPIPPTTMDGAEWSISTTGYSPDWSDTKLTIRGDQGPFSSWASLMLEASRRC